MQSNSMKMLLFTTCFLVLVGFIQSEQQVEVVIKNGPIIGQKIAEQGHSINQFLGIPYAQPPVGKLRFRRPVPAESWKEPLKALHWPNNCVQTLLFPEIANWHLSKNFTEDCLYLNIWSPDVTANDDKLRPVLVWIHGGGLIIGSNSFMSYNGRTLSSMADALVVTINYRLSTLGFLYSDEVDDVKGNQAFWDQTLALEWVKENIRYFGGDPSQITIFGESAGSWSVSALILSPVSRNLFKNAIMMSGSVTYGVVDDAETIVTKQLKGIRAVGCATDSDTTISRKVVECLEQLEPEKVDSIYYKSAPMFHSIAVVDSQFFPENPSQMLANGNHKKNFNLLVDTVEDEGTGIFILTNRDSKIREVNTEPLTLKEAHDILSKEVSNTFPKHKASKDAFNKVYFNGINGHLDNPDLMRKQVGVAFGDFFLTCPTINFAKSVFGNNPDTVNVYQWFYTAKLGKPSFTCPEWTGACHGDDLQPVFGIPFQSPPIFHNRMRDISREVITFIKSFIRTGTPGDEQSEWQSYFMGADGQTVVAPYYEVGIQPKSHSSLKLDLKRTECDLWNQYYY